MSRQELSFPRTSADHRAVLRRIARGWMSLGSLLVVFVGAVAVAHYEFGMSVVDTSTGLPNTPEEIRSGLLLIGGGGAFLAVLGAILLWCVREARHPHFWVKLGVAAALAAAGIAVLRVAFPAYWPE